MSRKTDTDLTEEVKLFLEHFRPGSKAESTWLTNSFTFVSQHLTPPTTDHTLFSEPHPLPDVQDAAVCVVSSIQQSVSDPSIFPVSYRLLSVSQLVSQQRLSCVSNLSWTTNQHQEWVREAELSVLGQKALQRVNLLLIGWLKAGRDGSWRLTDSSGSVQCECLSPSPLWLNRPVFLPHWNYIPHNPSGGCLELIGPPVMLCPSPEPGLATVEQGERAEAVGVREALGFFQDRVKGQRVTVQGRVGVRCPLLVISGNTFFCFTITDGSLSLPVLIKDTSQLSWFPCLRVGLDVCVTAMRVCVFDTWRGRNILCPTDTSQLHTHTHMDSQSDTHSDSQSDMPLLVTSQAKGHAGQEAEPQQEMVRSGGRTKRSKVINYQGTVTEVVNEGAGLYVIDGKVGLCLAYQPQGRRSLRVGDRVELHHVHFLYRPCPDFPPSMLCACLRSSIRVSAFSSLRTVTLSRRCPGDGPLQRVLLTTHGGVSDYLWACHLSSGLVDSLVPPVLSARQCVCAVSWKVLQTLRGNRSGHRDIYAEMLDQTHCCPVAQYQVDLSVHQYLSVSELVASLQLDCWSSLCLRSLLPPGGPNLNSSLINSAVSWSCRTLSSAPGSGAALRRRPLLLVGVLQLPSHKAELHQSLQLSDGTGSIACVVTETSQEAEGQQRAASNTAWIGCLVCVLRFTMVTERFLQSNFPSYQHLDQDKFITHKHCRSYLQFSLDDLHILSPSVAMETHLHQKEVEPASDVTAHQGTPEEEEYGSRKRKSPRIDPAPSSVGTATPQVGVGSRPCVSVVMMVEQKEGVALRKNWVQLPAGGVMEERRLSFTVKAALIGREVCWGRDPKNEPMTDRETGRKVEKKVLLELAGVCSRWFPVLQPGRLYRLVAVNCQDPSILIGSPFYKRHGVVLHADSTLQVKPEWRFHTLTRPLLTCTQRLRPPVMSVSEVLDCSSDLVCFHGVLSERISLNDKTHNPPDTYLGVRLTVCDQDGTSIQVYMDLSHTPYPPGLLPGNTVLLSAVQRRVSRTGNVYCKSLQVSSVTALSLADSCSARPLPPPPPPPMMHLGRWSLDQTQRFRVGRVKGHMVCLLSLQLQWSCSLCASAYTTQGCSSSQCHCTSSVFQSDAKVVVEDGTGEAHVWFSGSLVRLLLGLAEPQWEGLLRALRVKGHIRIYPQGQSLVSNCNSDDAILHFLLCTCSRDVISRPINFTCRRLANQRTEDMKTFSRGCREFRTRLFRPLQLTCLQMDAD